MRVTNRDPMTGNEVQDRASAPYGLEGSGDDALKVYFESEESRRAYLAIPPRVGARGLLDPTLPGHPGRRDDPLGLAEPE